MPALLHKDLRVVVDVWMKNSIHINIHQVFKILIVAACHRINRFLRVSHGVQKGVHGTFDKFYKRILERIFVRTAKHGMFNDMRYTGRVLWRCAKSNVEHLIVIIILDQTDMCPTFLVAQHIALGI